MKIFKTNKKKKAGAIVAIILVIATVVLTATTVFADNQYLYVSDIAMATGTKEADVIKQLTDAGYTVAKKNLCDGNGQFAYMGYKTTDNVEDAITDVRLMNMSSGFKMMDYRALQTAYNVKLTSMAKQFQITVNEMKQNIAKNSPLALAGKELLDLFYYETMDGEHIPFSDYLFDENRTLDDFININLMCNTLTLSVIFSALNLGVDDSSLVDVGARFSKYDVSNADDGSDFASLDKQYSEFAKILSDEIVAFYDSYQKGAVNIQPAPTNASAIMEDEDVQENYINDIKGTYSVEFSDEYKTALKKSEKDDSDLPLYDAVTSQTATETVENDDNYVLYVALYQAMKEYTVPDNLNGSAYGNPENLGDYLIGYAQAVKGKSELSDNDLRYLYPLAASFTDGQRYVVKLSGIISMMFYIIDPSEKQDLKLDIERQLKEDYFPELKQITDEKNIDKDNRVNVFVGTNVDAYNKQIALTEEGNRNAAAKKAYDELTVGESNAIRKVKDALTIAKICALAAAGATILFLTGFFIATGSFSLISAVTMLVIGGSWLVGGTAVAGLICAIFSVVFVVVLFIAIVAFVVFLIWKAILNKKEKDEANKPATYSTIPDEVYDYLKEDDEYRFVGYDAVRDPTGKIADINNYKSVNAKSQWDVLYFTKDETAGSPLVVEKDKPESLFTFSNEKYTPEKMMPLCRFGDLFASNVRTYQNYETKNNLYTFFKTEKSVKGEEGGSAEEQGVYLQSLKIASDKNAQVAKLSLQNAGYEVIETNISPNAETYSYIGFKTTTSTKYAIKDIRAAYGSTDTKTAFMFGTYSYGCAGITANNVALYYSSIEGIGTPIYANLSVSNNKDKKEESWEPVNLFSGGDAFDFNYRKGLSNKQWDNHVYIYFEPTEKFSSKNILGLNTEKYADGFAFFIIDNTDKNAVESFMNLNGFEIFKVNTNSSSYYSNEKDVCKGTTAKGSTYMAVSKTANPYRAITDIGLYDASPSAKMLFENISCEGCGYSVCETFLQYDNKRSIRDCNAYVCGEGGENGPNYYPEKITDAAYLTKRVINEEGQFDDLIYRGVYVKGPCDKTEPLLIEDILFSENSRTPDGYKAVTNLDDGYGTNARNIVCEYKNPSYTYFTPPRMSMPTLTRYTAQNCTFSHHLYIHIKGNQVKKGKYVSDIFISSYDDEHSSTKSEGSDKFSDDIALTSVLNSFGKSQIIKTNIARDTNHQSYNQTSSGFVSKEEYGNSSYIAVKYTDNINEALRNIVMVRVSSYDEKISDTLEIGNVEYTRCGNVVNANNGCYYLFQSKNSFFGTPITGISVNTTALDNNSVPVLTSDGKGMASCNYFIKFLRYAVKAGDTITSPEKYLNKLNFVVADNKESALLSLFNMGCTNFIDYNVGVSKNVYFGYATTTEKSDKNVITSICCSQSTSNVLYNGTTHSCINTANLSTVGNNGTYLCTSTDKRANPITSFSLVSDGKTYSSSAPGENYYIETNSFSVSNDKSFTIRYYPSNYWSYKNGVLTIRCHGDMPDYNDSYAAPWSKYATKITDVVIESLVTSIDAQAFTGCSNLKTVRIENDAVLNKNYKDITIQDGAIPTGVTIIANINSNGVTEYINSNTPSDYTLQYYNLNGTCHNSNFTFELNGNKLTIKGSGILGDDSYTSKTEKLYLDGGTGYRYMTREVKNHNYSKTSNTPWGEALADKVSGIDLAEYFKNITELEIDGEITSIATDFFKTLTSLKKITVKSIGGTGYNKAFGDLSNAVCNGYLDSGFRQYCVGNDIEFHYIPSQSTPTTAKKTAEQWEVSGNTLIIKKSGTYKNKGTDDCHVNSEYNIDKASIRRVLIFNTVKALPDDSFNGYTNLKEVVVVSDVDKITTTDSNGKALVPLLTAISNRCFKNCKALANYAIAAKVTSIGNEAFSGCSILTGITIPSAVKSVGENAFNSCSNIESINLPTTVASVGNCAFVGCKEGFTLTVNNPACAISPESAIVDKNATIIAPINSHAYASAMLTGCNFTQLNSSENVNWKLNNTGKLTVSANGSVKNNWSNLVNYITEIEFASGVTSVPEGALSKYPKLTKVTFPSTLKEIPDSFCEECKELKTVVIPKGIEKIGNSAFKNCAKLDFFSDENRKANAVAYVFPDSIKEIGSFAFNGIYDADGTTSGISLPLNIEKIGERAFCFKNTFITTYSDDCEYGDMAIVAKTFHFKYDTDSNTSKYFRESYKKIKTEYGFNMYQTTISDFSVEGNTVYIGEGFVESYYDSSLTPWNRVSAENVVFCGMSILSKGCFKNNRNIKTITFDNSKNNYICRYSIPQDCFRDCTNLKTIKMSKNAIIVRYGLSSFMNCNSLNFGHSLPDGAEYIDNFAFDKCENLFSNYAVLPETLTYIGSSAFSSNNALTISLPRSLEKICNCAIYSPNWTVLLNSQKCEMVYRSIIAKAIYSPEYDNVVAYYNRMKSGSLSTSAVTMEMKYIADWNLEAGILTISGNHDMYNYPNNALVPWYAMRNEIDKITIEEGVSSIGSYAFNDIEKLDSISIASSVSKIEKYSLCNLPLTLISLYGEDVTASGNNIFGDSNEGSVTVKCLENSNTYNKFNKLGYKVEALNYEAYSMNGDGILKISYCDSKTSGDWKTDASTVTKVIFDDSITELPRAAFADFTKLTEVKLPSNLKSISNEAFKNCTALKSVTIPKSVTWIGDSAFENCTSLNLCDENMCYAFNNAIKYIGQRAFYGVMENDECYISLPKSLKKLGSDALNMEYAEFYINSQSTVFSNNAFNCYMFFCPLNSTAWNYSVERDEYIWCAESATWSFENNTLTICGNGRMPNYHSNSVIPWHEYAEEIENIVVEEGVSSIGDYAFNSLPNLKTISLPSTLTSIGSMSLYNIGSVDTIYLKSDIISYVASDMMSTDKTAIKFTNSNYSSKTWNTLSSNGYDISYASSAVGTIFAGSTSFVIIIALIILVVAVIIAVIIKKRRLKKNTE